MHYFGYNMPMHTIYTNSLAYNTALEIIMGAGPGRVV